MALTYNQVVAKIRSIAEAHVMVRRFGEGDPMEQTVAADEEYPVVWVVPQAVQLTPPTMTMPVKIIVCDVPSESKVDEAEIRSDTLEICKDILAKLRNDPAIMTEGEVQQASAEPFYEKDPDVVTGWIMDLSIVMDFTANSCAVPA